MTKQRFNILGDTSMTACITAIIQAPRPCHVVISDKAEARTQAQNRLYWLWLGVMTKRLGDDSDSLHVTLKRKFLAPIYARDDGEMAALFYSVHECKKHLPADQYEQMAHTVACLLSTTQASTKQFTEYLNRIERWAYAEHGIGLPIPDDLKWAME